ncbi:MAG: hypothetical protein IKP62_09785 [Salinivirgaceae bacterium]|nr:hypothetical protein [Salinivirgaceae bacterium]
MTRKLVGLILVAIPYLLLAYFVFWVINPLSYSFFQQPAFVLTSDFLWTKVGVPGGLAEYLQLFVDQFTMFRFWGTLMLVAELLLTAFLVSRYVRKVVGENRLADIVIWLLPAAIAFVAWTDVKYAFAINMQVLLLAAVLNLQQALSRFDWNRFVTPLLAIAVYHACGPVALYAFALCEIVGYFLNPDRKKLVGVAGAVAVAALWPLLVYKFMLPIKPNAAFYDMRPQEMMFTSFNLSAVLYLLYLYPPLMLLLTKAYGRISKERTQAIVTIAVALVVVVSAVAGQQKRDNLPERIGFRMGAAAYHNDWNQIINYVKENEEIRKSENYDRFVNFFYNMALAAKGQLCDKMFSYPQRLGESGLFINEPMATVSCLPMTILFHQVGLATNALHYAFEAQSTYTSSHYVMRYVIDELLIIGDYESADKYLAKYSNTMFSKRFVDDRRKFLAGESDTEFAKGGYDVIRSKHPRKDFYMKNSQYDMLNVVMNDQDNMFATEYLVASVLLEADLDKFMKLILSGYCKMNLNALPRACQEAVALYRALYKDVLPGTEKAQVQSYILNPFKSFQQVVSRNGSDVRGIVDSRFTDTYWRYYFFLNPKVTGVSLSKK